MSPSPRADTDPPAPAASITHPTWRRRWRRLRVHMRLWRTRMHSHPVLRLAWRSVVVVIGGVILLAGVIMCVTPGPGALGILLGLAILATEFSWARGLLNRAHRWELRVRAKAHEAQVRRRERRAARPSADGPRNGKPRANSEGS